MAVVFFQGMCLKALSCWTEAIVLNKFGVKIGRLLWCPGSVWQVKVDMMQSKTSTVALWSLKAIHERLNGKTLYIHPINMDSCMKKKRLASVIITSF